MALLSTQPTQRSSRSSAAVALDFRNSIATADQDGRRKWVYPKKPKGRFHRARAWVATVLLVVMFGGPFVKISGNPLLMINVVERKFSVLGVIFGPQDNLVFALEIGRASCRERV